MEGMNVELVSGDSQWLHESERAVMGEISMFLAKATNVSTYSWLISRLSTNTQVTGKKEHSGKSKPGHLNFECALSSTNSSKAAFLA